MATYFAEGVNIPGLTVNEGTPTVLTPGNIEVYDDFASARAVHRLPQDGDTGVALSFELALQISGQAGQLIIWGSPSSEASTVRSYPRFTLSAGESNTSHAMSWQGTSTGASGHSVGSLPGTTARDVVFAWDRLTGICTLTVEGVADTKAGLDPGCKGLLFEAGGAGRPWNPLTSAMNNITVTILEPVDLGAQCFLPEGGPLSVRGTVLDLCGPGPCDQGLDDLLSFAFQAPAGVG